MYKNSVGLRGSVVCDMSYRDIHKHKQPNAGTSPGLFPTAVKSTNIGKTLNGGKSQSQQPPLLFLSMSREKTKGMMRKNNGIHGPG